MVGALSRVVAALPLRLLTVLAIAAGSLASANAAAQGLDLGRNFKFGPASRPSQDLAPAASAPVVYAVGDQLKITIFERIAPMEDEPGKMKDTLSGFVERVDLTGVYLVQGDGSVFLPMLGSLHVVGQTPQKVEQLLTAVFKNTAGGEAKVSIVITEREPIYVLGPVPNPGTYKYSPGMTVLHAIALSGSLEGGPSELSQVMETMREREKLERSEEHLKRLLARAAVLRAEREGRPAVAPGRLVELTGEKQAGALIQNAATLRKFTLTSKQIEESAAEAAITAAREELASLREKVRYVESNIKDKSERLAILETLHSRGTGNVFNHSLARSEKADVEERRQEVLVAIAQAVEKLAQAEHAKLKLAADRKVEFEQELSTIENDMAEEELTQSSSGKLLKAAGIVPSRMLAAKQGVSYEIVRRSPKGLQQISATEMTILEPGDLLRIAVAATVSQ